MTRPQADIEAEIRRAPGGEQVLSKATAKRDVLALPEILADDEAVVRIIEGFYEGGWGVLVATDRRMVFVDKALLGGRVKVEDFPYDRITSIQYDTGFVYGGLTIHAAGNRAEIANLPKDRCRDFAESIRRRIDEARSSVPTAMASGPSRTEDLPGTLERLADLRDRGILTEEEFQGKKRQILDL